MTKVEQLTLLIKELDPSVDIPQKTEDQWRVFRSLVNMRSPQPISEIFLQTQDALLASLIQEKGITDVKDLQPVQEGIYLWRGDITTIKADAIVNAANSGMLGCFFPCHACIDNVIHTYAGVQLRLKCAEIMEQQGYAEQTGQAKITPAYNLPSQYILHTVGPIVSGPVTQKNKEQLRSSYRSCLDLAGKYNLESIVFCCISTGEFHFPQQEAAQIAIETVTAHLKNSKIIKKVVFNVFTQRDEHIY
ncbi:MAG: protein-ADP-ribose hydrolase, partial [Clostridiales bacterium]|nr:protein-ADP-ribose hydrolase [Clostridiales bacterium]